MDHITFDVAYGDAHAYPDDRAAQVFHVSGSLSLDKEGVAKIECLEVLDLLE